MPASTSPLTSCSALPDIGASDEGSVGRIDPIGREELPGDTACCTLCTPYQDLPAPEVAQAFDRQVAAGKTQIGS